MNKCGCKNNKWGDHGNNLGKVVEHEGELWHYKEDMHWHDKTIAPGLWRMEGNCQIVKRLNG